MGDVFECKTHDKSFPDFGALEFHILKVHTPTFGDVLRTINRALAFMGLSPRGRMVSDGNPRLGVVITYGNQGGKQFRIDIEEVS